ncbi:MAG: ribonuclease III [Oligoflexales bacterium]
MNHVGHWQNIYPEKLEKLGLILTKFGIKPNNFSLYVEAITHSSAAKVAARNQPKEFKIPWNERLEFLGDAVLGLSISASLLNHPQEFNEGELSKIRAALVNEKILAAVSRKVGLDACLIVSEGDPSIRGFEKSSVLADAIEALFGAIFLDLGYEVCKEVVLSMFESYFQGSLKKLTQEDYKSRLQEKIQSLYKDLPKYHVVSQVGPDHKKRFEVEVTFRKKVLGTGIGDSKKSASQIAAKFAMEFLANNKNLGELTES